MASSKQLSLRFGLLLPLLLVSTVSALFVAMLSSVVGRRWALQDVDERFAAIEQTVQQANFPLTSSVIESLAKLSGTDLIALDERGESLVSTLHMTREEAAQLQRKVQSFPSTGDARTDVTLLVGQQRFLALGFQRQLSGSGAIKAAQVVVLFDETRVLDSARRAALLPLVTGLSIIIVLTTLMILMTGRLAARLAQLQRGVERVADGDFNTPVADNSNDEVGKLGHAVDRMAVQLQQLWQQIHRQQSQKVLHQIAGGMAHQLRNTLTGARLALELHQQSCPHSDQGELEVALREMEGAEDYVRRLLLVGAGEQKADQAASVLACLQNVRTSHMAVAKHLRVDLAWQFDEKLGDYCVQDGATFSAAVSNLVLNGLQAATAVRVHTQLLQANTCVVTVSDNGPGISPSVAEQLFEPFISTKPEGMGLGLPLVRRAADKLSGQVKWNRRENRTIFEFHCKVAACPT